MTRTTLAIEPPGPYQYSTMSWIEELRGPIIPDPPTQPGVLYWCSFCGRPMSRATFNSQCELCNLALSVWASWRSHWKVQEKTKRERGLTGDLPVPVHLQWRC